MLVYLLSSVMVLPFACFVLVSSVSSVFLVCWVLFSYVRWWECVRGAACARAVGALLTAFRSRGAAPEPSHVTSALWLLRLSVCSSADRGGFAFQGARRAPRTPCACRFASGGVYVSLKFFCSGAAVRLPNPG